MPELFSLVRQAWVPVALEDGRREFVRPSEYSQPVNGQKILRVATGRPDCDISLMEFLIGLLALTMTGLGQRDWYKRFGAPPSSDELETAFAKLEPALLLDGEGARFFQDFEPLDGQAASPISGLQIDAPGANALKDNADHFVKRGQTECLSRAGAALALLTLQTQAPSGGAGHRTSLRGGGPVTTLVVPGLSQNTVPTLWQILWSNVPEGFQAKTEQSLPQIFPWLVPTRLSDKSGVETTPEDVHPAQAFFGMPRRIRLNFEENSEQRPCDLTGLVDDIIVTSYVTRPWGTNYSAWSKGHPLSPYYRTSQDDIEFLPLHLKSSSVGYRQYIGLVIDDGEDNLKVPARCVAQFPSRAENLEGDEIHALKGSRLLVAGYAMDNMKPLDFTEALLPLIITGDARSDQAVSSSARAFVKGADVIARQLVSSVKRALYGVRGEAARDSTVLAPIGDRFWAETEQDFYNTLGDVAAAFASPDGQTARRPADVHAKAAQDLKAKFTRRALRIFDDTVPIESAESKRIEDVVEGRRSLSLCLNGYGAAGRKLFTALSLPLPAQKSKSSGKAKA